MTSSDDVSDHLLASTPLPWQPSGSRDDNAGYHGVLGGLLVSSCVLVVVALAVYLCSVVRADRRRARAAADNDDVIDHVTVPSAVTSLGSSSPQGKGLLRSLLATPSDGEPVTWYGGSRDVEVGRPSNVRYVSLRRWTQQSSSVESETGVPPASRRLTPLLPKRFGFVGWTRTATPPAPPGDCLRHQSSSEMAFSDDQRSSRLAVADVRCVVGVCVLTTIPVMYVRTRTLFCRTLTVR